MLPRVDASVEVDGTSATVKASSNGVELKRDELSRALLAAYTTDNRTITAPVQTAHPKISNAAAEAAKATAIKMMAEPADRDLRWQAVDLLIQRHRQDDRLSSRSSPPARRSAPDPRRGRSFPAITESQAEKTVAPKLGAVYRHPCARTPGSRRATAPSRSSPQRTESGRTSTLLAADITSVLKDSENSTRTVEIKTTVVSPKLTTEKAREMGISERISTFTTTYDGSNKPRVNNIHTLGDALDGKLDRARRRRSRSTAPWASAPRRRATRRPTRS